MSSYEVGICIFVTLLIGIWLGSLIQQTGKVKPLQERRDSFAIGFANWLDIQTIYLISNNTNSQLLELYKQSLKTKI